MSYSIKQKVGATVYDLPRFIWAMRPFAQHPWVLMRNRNERLIPNREQLGAVCDWQWTSDLHIAKVFPALGRRLMRRALQDWPIRFQTAPVRQTTPVQISFIIGHRGIERLPHLLLTLQSIAAQRAASFECVVVEQSLTPEIKEHLPSWVEYLHTPLPRADMLYCRSWAFNVGARAARGQALVLHDNDMLVPEDYSAQLAARFSAGYEAVNLKRFIFFLNRTHSARVLHRRQLALDEAPESVMQNAEGGGSIAISREAFFAIGGLDESFVGWGGEDIEFWERSQTLRVWPYGYLPLVHIWHEAQPGKRAVNGDGLHTAELTKSLLAIPPKARIDALRSRRFGETP